MNYCIPLYMLWSLVVSLLVGQYSLGRLRCLESMDKGYYPDKQSTLCMPAACEKRGLRPINTVERFLSNVVEGYYPDGHTL